MLLLLNESKDKKCQTIIEVPRNVVLEIIQHDHNLHEVIDMTYPTRLLRVFFDIDTYDSDPLDEIVTLLCKWFGCLKEDWAISCGNRGRKISYHIMSRKFSMSIQHLRKVAKKCPYADETILYFSLKSEYDRCYCRLPNQSKNSIHKAAPPMKILQGELSDFLITEIDNLIPIHETHLVIP